MTRAASQTDSAVAGATMALVLEDSPQAWLAFDRDWRCLAANAAAERLLGFDRRSCVGKAAGDLLPQLFQSPQWSRTIAPAIHSNAVTRVAIDGFELRVSPSPAGVALFVDRIEASARIAGDDDVFRQLTDNAPVLIWVSGPDKSGVYFNKRWLEFTGRPIEQELGAGWLESVHPDDLPALQACVDAFEQRRPFTTQFRLRRHDGEYRWVLDSGVPRFRAGGNNGDGSVGNGEFLGFVGSCVDITDRRDAEEARRQSEERYRSFIANSSEAIWRFEASEPVPIDLPPLEQVRRMIATAVLVECNDAMARMYGFAAASEIEGTPLSQMMVVDDPRNVEYLLSFIHNGYRITDAESREVDRDGAERVFLNNMVGVIEDGALVRGWGTQRDVTERRAAEAKVRESEGRLRLVTEAIPQLVWTGRPDGYIDYCNGRWLAYTGLTEDQVQGDGWAAALHPDDVAGVLKAWHSASAAGTYYSVEQRLRGADGVYRWFLARATPLRDVSGKIIKWYGTCTDIEALKQAERLLHASERRFRESFENAPVGMVLATVDGRYLDVNHAYCRIVGYSAEELLGGLDFKSLTHPDDRGPNVAEFDRVLRGEAPAYTLEKRYVRKDGGVVWARVTASLRRDDAGRPLHFVGIVEDITARKGVEEALRDSERRLRLIADATPVAIALLDQSERFLFVNRTYAGRLGLAPSQVIGRPCAEVVGRAAYEAFRPYFERAMAGETVEYETEIPYAAIGPKWMRCAYVPQFGDSGEVVSIVVAAIDLTERRQAEERLRELTQRLRFHVENSPLAVIERDRNWVIRRWTGEAEQVFGYTAAEAVGRNGTRLPRVHEDDRSRVERVLSELVSGQSARTVSRNRNLRKDGRVIHCEWYNSALVDERGEMVSCLSLVLDVTQREQALAEVRDGRARLQLAIDAARIALWDWDVAAGIVRESENMASIFALPGGTRNRTPQEWAAYVHPDDANHVHEAVDKGLAAGGEDSIDFEHRVLGGDGVTRWAHVRASVARDGKGRATHVIGLTMDVTPMKGAAAAQAFLAEASRVLSGTLDTGEILRGLVGLAVPRLADFAVLTEFHDGREVAGVMAAHADSARQPLLDGLNEALRATEGSGLLQQVAASRKPLLMPALAPDWVTSFCEDVQGQEALRRLAAKSLIVVPLIARGEIQGVLLLGRCDSQRIHDAESLRLAEELTSRAAVALDNARLYREAERANLAKDQFLAVLSHELRTPLTPVVMSVAAMEMDRTLPPQVRSDLEMIRRNIDLETKLIDDLLDVTRIVNGKLRLQPKPTDAHVLLRNVGEILRSDFAGKGIGVFQELRAEDARVSADPARLQQVIWNLVKNAIKFTPRGGRVTVRTANPAPRVLRIEVIDTGIGIEPHVLPRLFNAFEQGDARVTWQFGGLGLGLAISKALAELHGGSISAHSEGPDKGARFVLELPLLVSMAGAGSDAAMPPGSADDVHARILLVEDHPDTQEMLRRLLHKRGYDVLVASGVAAAMDVLDRHRVDVLVSDIGLPDGTGHELMRAVREAHGIPGVAVSGFGMDADLKSSQDAGFASHLIKPIDVNHLDATIRGLVAKAGRP